MIRRQLAAVFWIGAGGSYAGFVHLETGIMPGDYQRLKIGGSFSFPLLVQLQKPRNLLARRSKKKTKACAITFS